MPSGCNAVRVYAIKTSESRLLGLRGRKRVRKGRGEKDRRKGEREGESMREREVKSEREAEGARERVKGNRWPRER